MVFPQYSIHLTRTPASLDSLSGLRIIASGKTTSEVVAKLGGAPTSIQLAETYAALQRGTADGVIFPWGGFASFKLGDVTSYHIDTALGGGPGLVFLAKKKYDALPEAARKVLDAHSGEAESRRYGAALDRMHEANRKATQAQANHKVVTLTPAQESKWKQAVAPVTAEWKAATPGSERVLALVREELPKIKAGR
jgi:TRAP-type C4-dicarboxylate transport system substrate-binding protein